MPAKPCYTVTRPDGIAWARTFITEAAAWRVIVGGCNSERERRIKRAEMERAGWRVASTSKKSPCG